MEMRFSERANYQEEGYLGKGSFAEVFKVSLQGKLFALKRIHSYHLRDENILNNIKRQISIMKKLKHPNIVSLIDIYETEHSLQLLLQYVPAGNLYDKIKNQQKLPQSLVKQYVLDILKAVKYLHSFQEPILHRDIKPENILITEDNSAKLCDFGSANMIIPDTFRQSYVGTISYMAPQVKQSKPQDKSLDLWCIGVLIYELLTGSLPEFDKQIVYPDYISRCAEDLIKKILMKDQKQRISIEEIQSHLWFTLPEKKISVSSLSERRSEICPLNQSVIRVKQRYQMKKSEIKGQDSNEKLGELDLMVNSSILLRESHQNAQIYLSDLKERIKLQRQIKKNIGVIEKLKKQQQTLDWLNYQFCGVGAHCASNLKEKIQIIQEKPQNPSYKSIKSLQETLDKLEKIRQVGQYLPRYYEERILTFKQKDIEQTNNSISDYIPKLKIKILEYRRDGLIYLKGIKKLKEQIKNMQAIDVGNDAQNETQFSQTKLDISTENFLIKHQL